MPYVTEEQAKEMWCPEVRATERDKAASNTWPDDGLHDTSNRCIGSRCMWWRWGQQPSGRPGETVGYWEMPRGYCGQAGRPE